MKRKIKRQALKQFTMAATYKTARGHEILPGMSMFGTQSWEGGPVEIYVPETNEYVCFTARECGLAPQP